MRTEYEILELVKKIAGEDSRINAAALCGSRADKSVPRDVYQDYDILLCVSELAPFKNNLGWLEENFGRTLIVQLPDEMELFEEPARNDRYAYLAIFEDGVRIDLTLATDACNIGRHLKLFWIRPVFSARNISPKAAIMYQDPIRRSFPTAAMSFGGA